MQTPRRPVRRDARLDDTSGRLARLSDLTDQELFAATPFALPEGVIGLPYACGLFEFGDKAPTGAFPSDLTPVFGSMGMTDWLLERHMLVRGKTGCGKTTGIILPLIVGLIQPGGGTVVVASAKGDLTPPVLEACRRFGARLLYVSPTEPERTLRWNAVRDVKTPADAQRLAARLAAMQKPGRFETSHFRDECQAKLAAAIYPASKIRGQDNLGAIAQAFRTIGSLRAWAQKYAITEILEFANEAAEGHNSRTSLSQIQSTMECFLSDDVAECVSGHDIDLGTVADSPTILLVHLPEAESARLRNWTTLFFSTLIHSLYQRACQTPSGRLPTSCTLVLDEFASAIGRLDQVARSLATFRSRRMRLVCAVQSSAQIHSQYEEDARMLLSAFGTHVAVPPMGTLDAQEISEESGLTMVEYAACQGAARTTRMEERALLTPYEVSAPSRDPNLGLPATWLTPSAPPFYLYTTPIYRWPEWSEFTRGVFEDTLDWRASLLPPARKLTRRTTHTQPPGPKALGSKHPKCLWCSAPDARLSDPSAYSQAQLHARINELLEQVGYNALEPKSSAGKWWSAVLADKSGQKALLLRILEELAAMSETAEGFYKHYVYSNTDGVLPNLLYARFDLLKKGERGKKHDTL